MATRIHLRNAPHRVSDGQTFQGLAVRDIGVTIQWSLPTARADLQLRSSMWSGWLAQERAGGGEEGRAHLVCLVQGVGDLGHRHGRVGPTPLSL